MDIETQKEKFVGKMAAVRAEKLYGRDASKKMQVRLWKFDKVLVLNVEESQKNFSCGFTEKFFVYTVVYNTSILHVEAREDEPVFGMVSERKK